MVEIYRLSPDCQVCGREITAGREQYNRGRRVCDDCKTSLEAIADERRQARAARLVQQLDRAKGAASGPSSKRHVLRKAPDKFVSYMLGERHYEEPARGCKHPKAWQERIKRERSI
ncbi:hypothetical protein [Paenibacillus sp. JJ-100]|uniref:hypothetical protein n=1 Tax=Paenibacillus sp. JJ-100 TaxID=2974896 RepID=UPI00232B9930|nr:hypothetical protein [Paenibacillus sp. JJ-100]